MSQLATGSGLNQEAADATFEGNRPSKNLTERRAQFEAVALPLAELLFAGAYRMTGSSAKAEDLVQETFVRAWQNFDRFTLGTNFKAWAFQIMTFLDRNNKRSARSREATVDFTEKDVLMAPSSGENEEVLEPDVDWNAVYPDLVNDEFKRALDRLDEDQRSVFLLVTLGGLTYQECADSLEIPIGTVMSRLFRTRKQLQHELTDYLKENRLAAG